MEKNKENKVVQLHTSPENYIKTRARKLAIGKCYINEGWAKSGFASILVSRKHINGNFTFAAFWIDLYCLGVKDTFYNFNANIKFNELLVRVNSQMKMEEIDYQLAHNIIYGALEYSKRIGFSPHKDFEISQYLLEENNGRLESTGIEFGLEGKPAVLLANQKHPAKIKATLERTVGKGNFIIVDEL